MEPVRKINFRDKEILIVDYSGRKGEEMIAVFEQAKNLALTEKGQYRVLNIFNDQTYISPDFMRHVEKELTQTDAYVYKQAIIGLSTIQQWILKGMTLWYRRPFHSFNSMDEALEFLVAEKNPEPDR